MHEADVSRAVSMVRRFQVYLAVIYSVAGVLVAFGSLLAIAYCMINSKWLPAIFVLLARKDLGRFLDGESTRLLTLNSKEE